MEYTLLNIILTSTIVATIVGFALGWVKEFFQKKSLDNEEHEKNLYSELRFHLMLRTVCRSNREELWSDKKKNFHEGTKYVDDQKRKDELLIENLNESKGFTNKLVNEEWSHIDAVKNLLVNNSKYIKVDDLPLIEKFFIEYSIRELVTGKSEYHKDGLIFSTEKHIHATSALFKVVDELYEKIKK